jgi:hypothetical protein
MPLLGFFFRIMDNGNIAMWSSDKMTLKFIQSIVLQRHSLIISISSSVSPWFFSFVPENQSTISKLHMTSDIQCAWYVRDICLFTFLFLHKKHVEWWANTENFIKWSRLFLCLYFFLINYLYRFHFLFTNCTNTTWT